MFKNNFSFECIRREISVVADKIRADAEAARIESEWKFAAMVGNEWEDTHKNKYFFGGRNTKVWVSFTQTLATHILFRFFFFDEKCVFLLRGPSSSS